MRLGGTERAAGHALTVLPSLFTLLNMFCGFACVLFSIGGRPTLGAALIGAAIVLDIADGAVARMVGRVTPFGLQFDSLADLVSFGVAPAVLAFTWALLDLHPLGWVVSFAWLAAAAMRLARFTATVDPRADKRFFVGLPSPGAAAVVAASVYAFDPPSTTGTQTVAVLAFLLPAVLMVTSVPYRSFRVLVSPNGRPWPLLVVVLTLAVGFMTAPAVTGCVAAYLYLVHPLLTRPGPFARTSPGPA